MPATELSHRYQAAVLWRKAGMNRYGEPTLHPPEEIRVDWDDTKREVLDSNGQRVAVDAAALVDRDIAVGSEMWLGELALWLGSGTGSGAALPVDVMVVKTFNSTPDFRNRYKTREVGLMKKANTRNALA